MGNWGCNKKQGHNNNDLSYHKTYLSQLPESPCDRHQVLNHGSNLLRIPALDAVMSTTNHREDLINGMVARQRAVEDVELAFQTLWDVITSSTRLDHGG